MGHQNYTAYKLLTQDNDNWFKWRYKNYPYLVVIPNLSLMEVSPNVVQYGKSKSNCQLVTE